MAAPKGLLNPWPEASAAPMRPISQPKPKLSSVFLNLYVCPMMIQPTRRSRAIATIHPGELRMRAHACKSEPELGERCAAAAGLDSMCGLFVAEGADASQIA